MTLYSNGFISFMVERTKVEDMRRSRFIGEKNELSYRLDKFEISIEYP